MSWNGLSIASARPALQPCVSVVVRGILEIVFLFLEIGFLSQCFLFFVQEQKWVQVRYHLFESKCILVQCRCPMARCRLIYANQNLLFLGHQLKIVLFFFRTSSAELQSRALLSEIALPHAPGMSAITEDSDDSSTASTVDSIVNERLRQGRGSVSNSSGSSNSLPCVSSRHITGQQRMS